MQQIPRPKGTSLDLFLLKNKRTDFIHRVDVHIERSRRWISIFQF